jgi:hypothetical protein
VSWTDPRTDEGADPIQDPDPQDLDDAGLEDTDELEPREEE